MSETEIDPAQREALANAVMQEEIAHAEVLNELGIEYKGGSFKSKKPNSENAYDEDRRGETTASKNVAKAETPEERMAALPPEHLFGSAISKLQAELLAKDPEALNNFNKLKQTYADKLQQLDRSSNLDNINKALEFTREKFNVDVDLSVPEDASAA